MVTGFAFTVLGVALAVTIPNAFTSGQVVSSAQVNANFTALKTAVDALEAKKVVAFNYTVPASGGAVQEQFAINNANLDNDPNWVVSVTLQYQGEGYDIVDKGFGVYYVNNKWVVQYFKLGQVLTGRKFNIVAVRP